MVERDRTLRVYPEIKWGELNPEHSLFILELLEFVHDGVGEEQSRGINRVPAAQNRLSTILEMARPIPAWESFGLKDYGAFFRKIEPDIIIVGKVNPGDNLFLVMQAIPKLEETFLGVLDKVYRSNLVGAHKSSLRKGNLKDKEYYHNWLKRTIDDGRASIPKHPEQPEPIPEPEPKKPIEKKIWPESFQAIIDKKKTYELRLQDFDIKEGDTLLLREWDPNINDYTGRVVEKQVGYVGKFKINELPFWSQDDIKKIGLQIISLK